MINRNMINSIFYEVKPFIPRSVQLFLRRRIALYKRWKYSSLWPIDPNSGGAPDSWRGWPEGKKFSLILSHDVDTLRGYNNVLKLAELEERLGFRSAFNFVPQRYGEIKLQLLDELRCRGFGIGVHGLKHDGKLFRSKKKFDRQAPIINSYLRKWKTRGFTSPSMHHNHEWLGDLDIDYSISTFDTDPFEPQPDGVRKIFPIWMTNGSADSGYVELPYTLPQDSTLFIILREKTISVWKRKLDWVAAHGGMVLINTHPDYMGFGEEEGEEIYPVSRYIEFLDYIRDRYAGEYYPALPSQIAAFYRDQVDSRFKFLLPGLSLNARKWAKLPGAGPNEQSIHPDLDPRAQVYAPKRQRVPGARPSNRHSRVAMLTYSFYESDNRVRRYAETLAQRGDIVDVISLRRPGQSSCSELNGVKVLRVQERVRNEKGPLDHFLRILKFFFRSCCLLTVRHLHQAYSLVHVHSVPDFEVFAALIPKVLGAKVILDIHDIVPEFFANKFHIARNSALFKALVLTERASTAFADHVIISNDLWKKTLCQRSVCNGKCTTILNFPDHRHFHRKADAKNSSRFVFLYPGSLNFHQGLDLAVEAFARVRDLIGFAELHIVGEGPAKALLQKMVKGFGLQDRVLFKDMLPLDEVAEIMADADVGIIPKRNDDFGGEAFSTKTLEFMSIGIPIILSRTKIDQFYFNDSLVHFFEPGSVDSLASAMLNIAHDAKLRSRLTENGLKFADENSWARHQQLYFDLVDK
jgi:glycosyltransferase involved in cell wall biosynthesis